MLTKESLNHPDPTLSQSTGLSVVSPAWHISATRLKQQIQNQLALPTLPLPSVPQPGFSKLLESHSLVSVDEHPNLPISLVTGELVFQVTDFTLPGPINFAWHRVFRSSVSADNGHGPGWTTPLSERLNVDGASVTLTDSSGNTTVFKNPTIGSSCQHRQEKLLLTRQAEHSYLLSPIGCDDFRLFRADGVSEHLPLVEIRDGFGNSISVDYKRGQVQKLVTSWGRSLNFEHTDSGQIKSIHSHDLISETNAQGLLAQYGYSEQGLLVEATDLTRSGECYGYEDNQLTSRDTQTGQSWQYSLELSASPARYHLAECTQTGERYQLKWRFKQSRAELSRGTDATWSYQLDNQGQVRQLTLPDGSCVRRLFDSYGNLCCESNAEGQAFYFRYNRSGQVTRMTDSLNRTTRIRYDDSGRPSLITDALNNHWQRRYGKAGELLEVRSPKACLWQFKYTAKGQLETLIDPEQAKIELQWDSQFNLIQLTDAENHNTRFEYDNWQRLERVIDACGAEQVFGYDSRGLVATIAQENLPTIQLQYNQSGQLTELTDRSGQITSYEYQHGLLSAIKRSADDPSAFQYDKQLRVIQTTNSAGLTFSTRFNACGHVCEQTDFHGRNYRFEYNKAGQVIEYRDPEVITTLERDNAGQLTKANNNSGDSCEFHYDPMGRVIAANNREALVRYQYDSDGRLISEHVDDQEFGSYHFEHQYDHCARKVKTIADEVLLQYQYSPVGRLFGIDVNGETVLRRIYDPCGRVIEQSQSQLQSHFDYTEFGQLLSQKVNKVGETASLIERQYEYNNQGHMSALEDSVFGRSQFSYNNLGKVTACDGAFAEQIDYNPQGLINQVGPLSVGYSAVQLPEQLGDQCLTADKRGNIVHRRSEQSNANAVAYNYTGWNQLSSIENGDFKTFYRYDALGRRLSKVVTHLKTKQQKKGSFKHNGHQLWADIQLTPKGERVQNYILSPLNAEPLAVVRDGAIFAMHQDANQHICELTNESGKVVWKNQAKLLGAANTFVDKPSVTNPMRKVGHYTDSESGLDYLWQDGMNSYRETFSGAPLSPPAQTTLGPVQLGVATPIAFHHMPVAAINLNNLSHLTLSDHSIAEALIQSLNPSLNFSKD